MGQSKTILTCLILTIALLLNTSISSTSLIAAPASTLPRALATDPEYVLSIESPLSFWEIGGGFVYTCAAGQFAIRWPLGATTNVELTQRCDAMRSPVADEAALYYYDATDNRIERVPVDQPTDPPDVLYDLNGNSVTHLAVRGNVLYWVEREDGGVENDSYTIRQMPKGGGSPSTLVDVGSGQPLGIDVSTRYLYWVDKGGVNRKHLPSLTCSITVDGCPVEPLYSLLNVAGGINVESNEYVVWWVTQASDNREHLFTTNCNTTCGTVDFRTVPAGEHIAAARHDANYIYYVEGSRLRRIDRITRAGETIAEQVTSSNNLELFEDYIYFVKNQNAIYRLPLSATAITRDIRPLGMEVTQGIQNVANEVPWVAGKPTAVRLYAQVVNGEDAPAVEARLRGYDSSGQELAGSPLSPEQQPRAVRAGDTLANRGSDAFGWLFHLPRTWISPSGERIPRENFSIRLVAEIDPRRLADDTDPNNNRVEQQVDFVAKAPTCLQVRPVWTDAGTVDLIDLNLHAAIRLAESMLPTADIVPVYNSTRLVDYEFYYNGPLDFGIRYFPFDLPTRYRQILRRLGNRDFWADTPSICTRNNARTLSAGIVPPNASWGNTAGVAYLGGSQLISKIPGPGYYGFTGVFRTRFLATPLVHEMGHNFDRKHILCDGREDDRDPDDVDPDYPYKDQQTGLANTLDNRAQNRAATHFGFEIDGENPLSPTSVTDMMGYCNDHWVSDYTWKAIFDATRKPTAQFALAAQATDLAYVSGIITPTANVAEIAPVYPVPAALASNGMRQRWQEALVESSQVTPSYTLRLYGQDGALLAEQPVTVDDVADADATALVYSAVMAWPTAPVARITLDAGEQPLVTRNAGPSAPTLSALAIQPVAGEPNQLTLDWQSTDADADPLSFNILYSPDLGETWQVVFLDYPAQPGGEQRLALDLSGLPGSADATGLIRIYASDGLHSAVATSAPFALATKPPLATILSPAEAQWFDAAKAVELLGAATDTEDVVLADDALHWMIDNWQATGPTSSVRGLAPGQHSVSFVATDSEGKSAQATASFFVAPLELPQASAEPVKLDGRCDDGAYLSAVALPIASDLNDASATAQLVRTEQSLWVCLSGLAKGVGTAGLVLDLDHSREAELNVGDSGYFVAFDGTPMVRTANESHAFAPAELSDFATRIAEEDESWQAELRLDAAIFETWQKQIGLAVVHILAGTEESSGWPLGAHQAQPQSWATVNLSAAPTITAVMPLSITVGSGDTTVQVTGSGFSEQSTVVWNGKALATTFVNEGELSATVTAADFGTSGVYPVTVLGAPEGGISGQPQLVTVYNPIPAIVSAAPDSIRADGAPHTIILAGSGFVAGAQAYWNGNPAPTTVIDANQLELRVATHHLYGVGNGTIAVENPPLSQGVSNSVTVKVANSQPLLPLFVPLIMNE